MRARRPDRDGFVTRHGVRTFFEVFGDGPGRPTVLFAPTWSIVDSQAWKAQVPYFARHYRVITFDGRGNGRSDRPDGAAAYTEIEFARDLVAVLDETSTERALLVALSCGTLWSLQAAADHPERVAGLVAIGPAVPLAPGLPERRIHSFEERLDTTDGWAKYNQHYWVEGGYDDFLEFFFGQMFHEPHSSKQIEDGIAWGRQIAPETLVATDSGLRMCGRAGFRSVCERVKAPVLVIHGDEDRIRPHAQGAALAELTGGRLVTIEKGGHGNHARDPVRVNRLIKDFADRLLAPPAAVALHPTAPHARVTTWARALRRPRKALYLSSPIGLGHAQRDVAIAAELRRLQPDLQIDWLTQHPVTAVLERAGERIHPASSWLASESAHIEDEAHEHDLHAFQAVRRMDEILVNNFMVFHDVVEQEPYDLVIGDEAWDVDYFLHENPELKRFAFAWMTDFVGWLPMPDGGAREAALTADYNAEMIEHRARFARVRDRSVFVGDPEDVVPASFGAGLPSIREWTERNFDFAGYVTGFDPAPLADREALRDRLGYARDARFCIVTVGGSGVGASLLRRVIDAVPLARRRVPDLSFTIVCGPRIDPESLPACEGVTYRPFVPRLYEHLAACDLAVVQGGLTTCMELTANRRPFIFVPLRHHFEQNFHVRHRLDRYGAGRHLAYEEASEPDALAAAIAAEIERPVRSLPVETGGALRAARLIHALL
jgi:pimeloyl-ACP methyl ester carboxylesterase/predicted glycosyltransferase